MDTTQKAAGVLCVVLTALSCVYGSRLPVTQPTVPPTEISHVSATPPHVSATRTTLGPSAAQPQDSESAPVEEIVVQQAASEVCRDDLGNPFVPYGPEFYAVDSSYGFRCDLATGHTASAHIEQFATFTEAEASFLADVEGQAIQDFHGYPFAAWETEFYIPDFGGKTRMAVLQVERWVIEARSDDDTHYLTAPDPVDVVDAIYRKMVELGMVPSPRTR